MLVVHELKLIHTDLKPENILLVNSDYTEAGNVGSFYISEKKTYSYIYRWPAWIQNPRYC